MTYNDMKRQSKYNDYTYRIVVKIPFAKGAGKFHRKGSLLHHLIKELNTTLRIVDEVFGHPIDIHLSDEDV